MRCLGQWVGQCQGDHPLGDVRPERLDPRGARLVAQQAVDAFLHEAFLPAPHASFGGAGPTHDLVVPTPSALSSTMAARQTCFWAVFRSLVSASRRWRSEDVRVIEMPVRMPQPRMWKSPAEIPFRTQTLDFVH